MTLIATQAQQESVEAAAQAFVAAIRWAAVSGFGPAEDAPTPVEVAFNTMLVGAGGMLIALEDLSYPTFARSLGYIIAEVAFQQTPAVRRDMLAQLNLGLSEGFSRSAKTLAPRGSA